MYTSGHCASRRAPEPLTGGKAEQILVARESALMPRGSVPEDVMAALRLIEAYLLSKNGAKQLSAKAKQRMARLRGLPPILVKLDTAVKRMRAQAKAENEGRSFSVESPYHLYGMATKRTHRGVNDTRTD